MKNEFFFKILFKPFFVVILFSLWPLLTEILLASYIKPFLEIFFLTHIVIIIYFIKNYIIYTKYIKFPSYKEAKEYYRDLKRVEREELKAKKYSIKKAKVADQLRKKKEIENKKIAEEVAKQALALNLKMELEKRKKKVL